MHTIATSIASALLMASMSAGAFAQAKNFEGLNVSGSLGYQTATVQTTDLSQAGLSISDGTPNGATLNLGAEYVMAIGNASTLGWGLETNVLPSRDTRVDPYNNGVLVANGGGEVKTKSSYAIFVAPGIAIRDDVLLYAKLSYVQFNTSSSNDDGSGSTDTGRAYGLGAGFKKLLGKNMFVFGEGNVYSFIPKDGASSNLTYTTKGTATNVSVGIGYKF